MTSPLIFYLYISPINRDGALAFAMDILIFKYVISLYVSVKFICNARVNF